MRNSTLASRSQRWILCGALIFAALAGAIAAGSASAATAWACYWTNGDCGSYKGLASGGAPIGEINRNETTGGLMNNQSSGTSKRIRVIDGANNTVAGWWSSSAQSFSVTWSSRGWVRQQCNNMEAYAISVVCGFIYDTTRP